MAELLTKPELAELLKMTKRQIDTLCESRTRKKQPQSVRLPVIKINGNVRFDRSDVDAWIERLKEDTA